MSNTRLTVAASRQSAAICAPSVFCAHYFGICRINSSARAMDAFMSSINLETSAWIFADSPLRDASPEH